MPREELTNAIVLYEGTSPLVIHATPCPSPPPRPQPAARIDPALLATRHPQPSPFVSCDTQPSPLAISPDDLRADTSILAPVSAAIRRRGRVICHADLGHASYASSPGSFVRRPPSPLRSHPTTEGTGGAPRMLPLRDNFSMRGELVHVCVSYRVATEGTGRNGNGNGLSGLLAQKIRSLSMHEKRLQIPRHGWLAPTHPLHDLFRCALSCRAYATRPTLTTKCCVRDAGGSGPKAPRSRCLFCQRRPRSTPQLNSVGPVLLPLCNLQQTSRRAPRRACS